MFVPNPLSLRLDKVVHGIAQMIRREETLFPGSLLFLDKARFILIVHRFAQVSCVNDCRGFCNTGASGGLAEMEQWMGASQPGERDN